VSIHEHNRFVGGGIYRPLPDAGGEDLPVRGRSVQRSIYNLRLEYNWRAARDASSFRRVQKLVQSNRDGVVSHTSLQALELADGRLGCYDIGAAGQVTRWQLEVPDGYLPPMVGDSCPVDLLNSVDAFPLIAWQQGLDQPPWPVLVHRDLRASDTTEASIRLVRLTVRPIMQLDADRWVFDEKGGMVRSDGVTTIELVTREKLLELMPAFQADLDEWDKEETSDE
jgi:hypothetical protein